MRCWHPNMPGYCSATLTSEHTDAGVLGVASCALAPASHAFAAAPLPRRSYQHFCRCGKQLDSRLGQLGASRFFDRADINREDWPAIDAWIDGVLAALPTLGLKRAEELGGGRG